MEDYVEESPALFMYELLQSIIRRKIMKPFQKLKSLILFSDDEPSIEVSSKHMPYELEIVELNLTNVVGLVKQRLMLDAFLTFKNSYLRRVRIEKAYLSINNMMRLSDSMEKIMEAHEAYLCWDSFGRLYESWKEGGLKFSRFVPSIIEGRPDYTSHDYTSSELG